MATEPAGDDGWYVIVRDPDYEDRGFWRNDQEAQAWAASVGAPDAFVAGPISSETAFFILARKRTVERLAVAATELASTARRGQVCDVNEVASELVDTAAAMRDAGGIDGSQHHVGVHPWCFVGGQRWNFWRLTRAQAQRIVVALHSDLNVTDFILAHSNDLLALGGEMLFALTLSDALERCDLVGDNQVIKETLNRWIQFANRALANGSDERSSLDDSYSGRWFVLVRQLGGSTARWGDSEAAEHWAESLGVRDAVAVDYEPQSSFLFLLSIPVARLLADALNHSANSVRPSEAYRLRDLAKYLTSDHWFMREGVADLRGLHPWSFDDGVVWDFPNLEHASALALRSALLSADKPSDVIIGTYDEITPWHGDTSTAEMLVDALDQLDSTSDLAQLRGSLNRWLERADGSDQTK